MEDMLAAIFRKQKEFVTMIKHDRFPATKEERISHLCTVIIHEAGGVVT